MRTTVHRTPHPTRHSAVTLDYTAHYAPHRSVLLHSVTLGYTCGTPLTTPHTAQCCYTWLHSVTLVTTQHARCLSDAWTAV
eukprot:3235949-Pyramimonas_sp.AAC.2